MRVAGEELMRLMNKYWNKPRICNGMDGVDWDAIYRPRREVMGGSCAELIGWSWNGDEIETGRWKQTQRETDEEEGTEGEEEGR